MPPKLSIICTDKRPLTQGQIRGPPGYCFKRGLKAGFAAGIRKGQQQPQGENRLIPLAPVANIFQPNQPPLLAIEDIPRARPPLLALPYEVPVLPELPRRPPLTKRKKTAPTKSIRKLWDEFVEKSGKLKGQLNYKRWLAALPLTGNAGKLGSREKRAMSTGDLENLLINTGKYSK
jgi:hypothetical protein